MEQSQRIERAWQRWWRWYQDVDSYHPSMYIARFAEASDLRWRLLLVELPNPLRCVPEHDGCEPYS